LCVSSIQLAECLTGRQEMLKIPKTSFIHYIHCTEWHITYIRESGYG